MSRYNSRPGNKVAGLGKNAAPLLKTVRGQQHATNNDHEPTKIAATRSTKTTAPTSAPSKTDAIDIDAEPLSSSDEEETSDAHDNKSSDVSIPKAKAGNKRKSDESERPGDGGETKLKRAKLEEPHLFPNQSRASSNPSNKYKAKGQYKSYNIHAIHKPEPKPVKEPEAPQNDKNPTSKPKKKSSIKFQPAPSANLFETLSVKRPKTLRLSQTDASANGSSQDSAIAIHSDATSHVDSLPNENDEITRCPICQGEVSKEDYDAWISTCPNITVREQRKFCKKHKLRDAQSAWEARGYPTINWEGFDKRLKSHVDLVRRIIKKPEKSHFRAQLEASINSGRGRTILKGLEEGDMFGVGYYGIKGQQAMTSFITRKFAKKLRKIAVTDRIVAARDVSGYIRTVLVPELALRLIEDDMKVDESTAREILEDSAEIGALLNGGDS